MGKEISPAGQMGLGVAGQVAGGLVGTGMGLLMEKHNDKRQIKQQQKLTNMQIDADRNLAQYNQDLQLDTWKKTNYPAQMAMLKEAGLNPALMYGQAGAGGQTGGGGASVSGATAPSGGGETMAMSRMGMESAMMAAQIANTQANTEKTKVEAAKIGGVDTQEAQSRIAQIAATIPNIEAKTALTNVEKDLAGIETEIKGRTIEDQIDIITGQAGMLEYQVKRIARQNGIEQATSNEVIQQIKAESVGALLRNVLTSAQTTNTKANTNLTTAQTATEGERRFLTREQARQVGQNIIQGWDGLNNEQKRQRLQENMQNYNINEGQMFDLMEQAVDGIMRHGMSTGPKNKQTWETTTDPQGNNWSKEKYEKYGK